MRLRTRRWTTRNGAPRSAVELDLGEDPRTGKRRRKLFGTKAAAKAWLDKRPVTPASELSAGTLSAAGTAWADAVERDGRAPRTAAKYRQHLRLHINPIAVPLGAPDTPDAERRLAFGDWKLASIDTPAVMRFKETLQAAGRSPAMVAKIMGSLRMLLNRAELAGLVTRNAARPVKAEGGRRSRRRIAIPLPEEARAILAAAAGSDDTVTLGRVLVTVLLTSGIRPGEARALAWTDLQLERRPALLTVSRAADEAGRIGPPKSAAGNRTLPLPESTAKLLRRWQEICPASERKLVFPTAGGHVGDLANWHKRIWSPLLIAAGVSRPGKKRDESGAPVAVPAYTPYACRHFYASLLIAGGRNPKEVQVLMGHEDIQLTLNTYGHLWPDPGRDRAISANIERALGPRRTVSLP